MQNTALRFMSECDRVGLKYRESRDLDEGQSIVVCGVNGKNNARYDVVFVFDRDGNAASLRVIGLVSFPEEKWGSMLELANELNGSYRWLKFAVRPDRVDVQGDAIINEETSGRVCVELFLRTMKIIDDIYPKFMHALWG